MIIEALRRGVAWLEDPETGVNALLPLVPRPAEETVPPAVRCFDETRHGWVARGLLDPTVLAAGPVLTAQLYEQLVELPATAATAAGGQVVPVVLRYAIRGPLTEQHVRDAWRTLRCAQRAIANRFDSEQDIEQADGLTYYPPAGFQHLPDYAPAGDGLYVGGLLVLMRADDPWALGITPL